METRFVAYIKSLVPKTTAPEYARLARVYYPFIFKVLASKYEQKDIQNGIAEYITFLRHGTQELPSLLVNLIWHAHLQDREAYKKDCLNLCDRVIPHVAV